MLAASSSSWKPRFRLNTLLVDQNAVNEKRVSLFGRRKVLFQRVIPESRLIIRGDRQKSLLSIFDRYFGTK